jgi:hypothetical protein
MTIPTRTLGTLGRVRSWIAATAALVSLGLTALAPSAAQARPPCVDVEHTVGTITQTVTVTNNCSYTVSFVIHRAGPDSPCLHASPGTSRGMRWTRAAAYQGTTYDCD